VKDGAGSSLAMKISFVGVTSNCASQPFLVPFCSSPSAASRKGGFSHVSLAKLGLTAVLKHGWD